MKLNYLLVFATLFLSCGKDGGSTTDPAKEDTVETVVKEDTVKNSEPVIKTEEKISDKAINCQNENVQKLYSFLYDNYGKKTISGIMANVSMEQSEAALVKSAIGKMPVIQTIDYIHLQYSWGKDYYTDISKLIEHYKRGGIIAAGWHTMVPEKEAEVSKENKWVYKTTGFKPSRVVKTGTWENTFFNKALEDCVARLALFKEEGIPVIWRPLHEASGAWFWWGQENAESYKKLWIYMFDFFKEKGLDNLIWVWTSQIGVGQWDKDDDSNWYPGSEYVDLIARDCYEKNAAEAAQEFEKIQKVFSGKMITLGECGSVGKMSEIFSLGGKYSYFMPWYTYNLADLDKSEHANTAWWKDAAESENVIFLEEKTF